MDTYTIEVTGIPEDLLQRLDKWMREQGRDRSQFIREIIEEKLQEHEKPQSGKTFAEILAPLQQDFEATGMSDEELGDFIDAEIKAHRAERRAKAQQLHG
jgi:metal-responsive CopG/Arc/MetJ family transcriptional regulator